MLADQHPSDVVKTAKREVTAILEKTNFEHYLILVNETRGFKALYARANNKTIVAAVDKMTTVPNPPKDFVLHKLYGKNAQ